MGAPGIFHAPRLPLHKADPANMSHDRDASPVRSKSPKTCTHQTIAFIDKDGVERYFWADERLIDFHIDNLRARENSSLDLDTPAKRLDYFVRFEAVPLSNAVLQAFDPWNFSHCERTTMDYAFDLLRLATEKQSVVALEYFFNKLESPHPYQAWTEKESWREYMFKNRNFYCKAAAEIWQNTKVWNFSPALQIVQSLFQGFDPVAGDFGVLRPCQFRTKQTARLQKLNAMKTTVETFDEDGKAEFDLRYGVKLCVIVSANGPVAVCQSRVDAVKILRSFLCSSHKCIGCTAAPCPYFLDERTVLELSQNYTIHEQIDCYKKKLY